MDSAGCHRSALCCAWDASGSPTAPSPAGIFGRASMGKKMPDFGCRVAVRYSIASAPRDTRSTLLRLIVISAALTALLAPAALRCDTIVLKNGRQISADSVAEEGDQVFYEGEDGRISIPKSLVDHVEKNSTPIPRAPRLAASSSANDTSGAAFAKALSVEVRMPQRDVESVVHGGAVDEERLAAIRDGAAQGRIELESAANAHLAAAMFEAQRQRIGP